MWPAERERGKEVGKRKIGGGDTEEEKRGRREERKGRESKEKDKTGERRRRGG